MGESFQADPTPVVAYTVVIHLEVYANSCRQGKRCRCQLDEDCGPENSRIRRRRFKQIGGGGHPSGKLYFELQCFLK